jgi:hypothetical protein
MVSLIRRRISILLASILVCLVTGCAKNLPSVRAFGDATMSAIKSADAVPKDLPASCDRTAEVFGLRRTVADYVNLGAQVPDSSFLESCGRLRDASQSVLRIHATISSYAKALHDLAKDDVVTYADDLETLSTSLKSPKNAAGQSRLDMARVSAVSELAGWLSNLATEGARQNRLKETIIANDPRIEQAIESAVDVIDHDYRDQLRDELRRLKGSLLEVWKKDYLKCGDPKTCDPLGAFLLYKSEIVPKEELIAKKVKAIDQYLQLMKGIRSEHSKLKSMVEHLDSKEAFRSTVNYVKSLKPIVEELDSAFN